MTNRLAAVVGGVAAVAAGFLVRRVTADRTTGSFTVCSSFGCNTYAITLVDITDNGDGTITVTWDRDGDDGDNNAVPTVTTEVRVAGSAISTQSSEWFPGEHVTETVTGAGQPGDRVVVEASTGNFDGGTATVSGTVPS